MNKLKLKEAIEIVSKAKAIDNKHVLLTGYNREYAKLIPLLKEATGIWITFRHKSGHPTQLSFAGDLSAILLAQIEINKKEIKSLKRKFYRLK